MAPSGRLVVLAAGKAAMPMARAALTHYRRGSEGLVIAPSEAGPGPDRMPLPANWQRLSGNHPVPGTGSLEAGAAALDLAASLRAGDLLLVLLSGGASSMMALPGQGVTLAEQVDLVTALMNRGAKIRDINAVRGALSRIKAGRLAAACAAPVVTLAASDVTGNDPAIIGSGPTWAPGPGMPDALEILRRHNITVTRELAMCLKHGVSEARTLARTGRYTVVLSGAQLLQAAAAMLSKAGYAVENLGDGVEGDARALANAHAKAIRKHHGAGRRLALLSGGEATVRIDDKAGRGGPNTEYLLALALALEGLPGCWALACDSDGIDGAGGHAGAVLGPDTLARGGRAGRSAEDHLARHDSAGYFDALGDLIKTGPTGTNVNDFRAVLLEP